MLNWVLNKLSTFFMRKIIFLFLLFMNVLSYSQPISGRVVDENNTPLEGVLVYLDNTSIATNTDKFGNFQLSNKDKLQTNVVFRFPSYQTQVLPLQTNYYVKLITNTTELHEIVIQKSKFSRKQLMAAFKENFLGTTKAGKNCKILNEDEINLYYDSKKFVLEAYCDVPIQIQNDYSEYIIDFDLSKFETQYTHYTLNKTGIKSNMFYGTSVFKDISIGNSAYKNRQKLYNGSSTHFFYNVINAIQNSNEFILYDGSFPASFSQHFEVVPFDDKFILRVISPDKYKIEGLVKIPWSKRFNVLFNKSDQSILIFKGKEIIIDKYGNYQPITSLLFGGAWSQSRLGNMLPLDFNKK